MVEIAPQILLVSETGTKQESAKERGQYIRDIFASSKTITYIFPSPAQKDNNSSKELQKPQARRKIKASSYSHWKTAATATTFTMSRR